MLKKASNLVQNTKGTRPPHRLGGAHLPCPASLDGRIPFSSRRAPSM
jgi:hypothetical protein